MCERVLRKWRDMSLKFKYYYYARAHCISCNGRQYKRIKIRIIGTYTVHMRDTRV